MSVPAFPIGRVFDVNGGVAQWEDQGMSLLDYFAGQALSTVLADRLRTATLQGVNVEEVTKRSYDVARAMLKERDKMS